MHYHIIYSHLVALAVAEGVEPIVEEVVAAAEALDGVGAVVMTPATLVRRHVVPKVVVVRRPVPAPAPVRPRVDVAALHPTGTGSCRRSTGSGCFGVFPVKVGVY